MKLRDVFREILMEASEKEVRDVLQHIEEDFGALAERGRNAVQLALQTKQYVARYIGLEVDTLTEADVPKIIQKLEGIRRLTEASKTNQNTTARIGEILTQLDEVLSALRIVQSAWKPMLRE